MYNNRKTTKAMALLYVVVTVGVLALAFVSVTEIGKARTLQAITAQSKSKAYEALDSMMECAMGLDRSLDNMASDPSKLVCGGVTLNHYQQVTPSNSAYKSYDMLIGKLNSNSTACAQAVLYRIDTNPQVPAVFNGYKVTMFVRGFSSCKTSGGTYIPQVKDPNFISVTEKTQYLDFAAGSSGY